MVGAVARPGRRTRPPFRGPRRVAGVRENPLLSYRPSRQGVPDWGAITLENTVSTATILGEVCFREGDGALLPIPRGPVEIDLADDSATFGWTASNGTAGSTAIPRDDYERYVREGKIRVNG